MADIKNDDNEPAFPSKRKPVETDVDDAKKQKLEASDIPEEKNDEDEAEDDDDEEEEDCEDDDDEEDDDEDGEHSNGKAVVDSKGKGIMKEDKGKGKLIQEDDRDDDDLSDGEGESDDDSDLSDDPLAEVDLDNILPSRTRRRGVNPGVYLANDLHLGNDDDSDDSDA